MFSYSLDKKLWQNHKIKYQRKLNTSPSMKVDIHRNMDQKYSRIQNIVETLKNLLNYERFIALIDKHSNLSSENINPLNNIYFFG